MILRAWISRRARSATTAVAVLLALAVGLPSLGRAGDATKPAADTDVVQRAVDAAKAGAPAPKPEPGEEQAQGAERTVVVAEPPPADSMLFRHVVQSVAKGQSEDDSLKELAEMYNSRESWILYANPGLSSENLLTFKALNIPAPNELKNLPSFPLKLDGLAPKRPTPPAPEAAPVPAPAEPPAVQIPTPGAATGAARGGTEGGTKGAAAPSGTDGPFIYFEF